MLDDMHGICGFAFVTAYNDASSCTLCQRVVWCVGNQRFYCTVCCRTWCHGQCQPVVFL